MKYCLGIDIGTTFSSMAVIDRNGKVSSLKNSEGKTTTPSVIYFDKDNIVVGEEANEINILGEANIAAYFKRNIGNQYFSLSFFGKDYSAEELTTILIKKLKKDAEKNISEIIEHSVITVPAYFNNFQRTATINSAKKAGFTYVEIINEPTAAAIAYGIKNVKTPKNIIVYDLGGGTFDVTLVKIDNKSIEVIASDGDHELGGKEWDDRLALYLVHKFNEEFGVWLLDNMNTYKNLTIKSEKYKKELSLRDETIISLSYEGKKGFYGITRNFFEELTRDLVERTINLTKKVIKDSNMKISDIDDILLVGGSSRMPMIRDALITIFNMEPLGRVNVEEVVSMGAAIQGGLHYSKKFTGFTLPVTKKVSDVIGHSLGMIAVNEKADKYINSIIIKKNTRIPCFQTRDYKVFTEKGKKNYVEVYILQGESEDPLKCSIIGKYVFKGMEYIGKKYVMVEVEYIYDTNGLVFVNAYQKENNKKLELTIEPIENNIHWLYDKPEIKNYDIKKSILIAIDLSGSMSGDPILEAMKAANNFMEEINMEKTQVGIVAFGDKVRVIQPLTSKREIIKSAITSIEKIDVGIGTSNQPLSYALKLLIGENGLKYLVILTDGKWYGANNFNTVALSEQCKSSGIEIIALGFGDAEEEFLNVIASAKENALYTVIGDLSNCFIRIAQEISKAYTGNSIKIFK